MDTWTAALASVMGVSLVSLVGALGLSVNARRRRQVAKRLVAFAVGALLGDAFIHLVPETFADAPPLSGSLLILSGLLLFFAIEKLLRHGMVLAGNGEPTPNAVPPLAAINLIGDALHNFIDGVLIAASYVAGPTLGITTTIAVLLHEIPQELGDFGVLIHSGMSVRRALLLNVASASAAILGTIATLASGVWMGEAVAWLLLPVAAGGFVYIAAADLIPELQRDRSLSALVEQGAAIAAGIAVMVVLALGE